MLHQHQLEEVLASLPDPAFILTRSGLYAAVYGGSDLRYYHDGSGLIGSRLDDVLHPDKAHWFLEQIALALTKRTLHVVEYGLAGRDVKGLSDEGPADTIWFEGRVQALEFTVEGEAAVLWVASNITARHQLEEQLRSLSETDPLTGLFNRRKLMQELQQQFDAYRRYRTPCSLLAFDMDKLKLINDLHGHASGDRALHTIAELCQRELRTTDIAARIGGDEFVVLMPNTELQQATILAERLRSGFLARLPELSLEGVQASLSGGLSSMRADDLNAEEVLHRADQALYRAKSRGRNRIDLGSA